MTIRLALNHDHSIDPSTRLGVFGEDRSLCALDEFGL